MRMCKKWIIVNYFVEVIFNTDCELGHFSLMNGSSERFVVWIVGWFVGLFVCLLVDWLADWLGGLIACLLACLRVWMFRRSVGRLDDWSVDWPHAVSTLI